MQTLNNLHKKTAAVAAGLLVCFFLSGCQLFAIGGQKLSKYCPGLNVKIDGINWHETGSVSVFILQYDHSYQQKVVKYFANPANGYTKEVGRTYYDQNIKEGTPDAVDTTTIGKIINKGIDTTASVYFDGTTERIIIIEKVNKKKN
jgi:hypothetical protein